ncbi:MAG TPA: T9SS type A sorting domain-containing protein [Flavobacterium sp.]|uniref:DUF7619 domain-containing protein n=1 Tax=Flavobacterium sp. TaxID=239 RepID=UPI002C0858BF|nr:T9SS type A sorting domain-containing protein [Flavobacterium sp.]HRE78734.1 T9SS type A sorting domain-containing protein [Flavobacterium sp.]
MKEIYTLALFVTTFFIGNAQIINIPDANFKAKLLEASPSNQIASTQTPNANGYIESYIKIDTNNNGEIEVSEVSGIKYLNVRNSNINSLDGISSFSALEYLICAINDLEFLNISQNLNLKELDCCFNQLETLNVSLNPQLTSLTCFDNHLTTLDVSHNQSLVELTCFNNQLTTLDVSQNQELEILFCSGNQLTNLDVSQNQQLKQLFCSLNQLSTLDISQNPMLRDLGCANNQITNLDVSQNSMLFNLKCENNLLTTLDTSNNIILSYLECSSNQLSSLNVSQSVGLNELSCGSNQLTTLDLTQNLNLLSVNCPSNQLTTLDITQNLNLQSIDCSANQLSTLDFSQNLLLSGLNCSDIPLTTLDVTQYPLLDVLICKNNQLSTLFLKNNNQLDWILLDFNDNPNLEYICADEDDIALVQQNISNYGYANCHVNSYCSFVPGGLFYTIQGNTKYDSNNNGCDDLDIIMPNQKFTITSGALSGSFIPDESGDYTYDVQSGTHVITPVLENPNDFIISPTSASVTFPTTTSPFTQDFCITPNGIKNDLEISIIPIEVARPGFDAEYKVIYKNKGNQVANGTLTFSFDDTIMDILSSIPSVDGSGTNTLNWNFTALNPFETREIGLIFNINSPMEIPAVNDGDVLVYTATIASATDETPNDNTFTLNQTVVNSYDPNDKTCLEGNTISPEMVGEYVHYVIRFENTGTFAAENVVIADVIDATKFEINTLIPQSSSHNFFARINGNKVEFIFENINLPFDDENNDGYVAFKIKTKPNLVLGDELTNTASIYFDYNFPIITNTTSTTIEEPLSNQDFDFETNFTLYPNPAKDVLNIKTKSEMDVKSVSIYNTLGQIIMTTIHAENGEINVSNLQTGSYFIKVFTDKGSSTAKFIKQ